MFGNGETTYHIILELYSGGNIILTDYKFEILALLRVYSLADGTVVGVKQRYDVQPSINIINMIIHRAGKSFRSYCCHESHYNGRSHTVLCFTLVRVEIQRETNPECLAN